MAWETLYCPNRACRCYGKPFPHSLLVKNGATRGQKQALCRACGRSIALNYGTASFELDSDPAIFETRFVRWRKEFPCAVPRGLSRLIRIRHVRGCIEP